MLSAGTLAEALWDESPPPNAAVVMRTYVMRLRRALGPVGARIVGRTPGWAVELRGPEEFDLAEVDWLWRAARAEAEAGEWRHVSSLLDRALSLWRGDPLVDVPSDALSRREADRLTDLRLQLIDTRIDADLRLGRHCELVAELRRLAAEYPLRENIRVQLMLACYRCGHQAAALQVYQDAYRTLVAELGVEPGPALRKMHQKILVADPALATEEPAVATIGQPEGHHPQHQVGHHEAVSRQFPAAVRHATGQVSDAGVFGVQLGACRRTTGLSQEELAERSGLSIRAVRNLERGHTRWPQPESVRRLADALGLKGEARREFTAAAGRRLAGVADPGASTPAGDLAARTGDGQIVPRQLPAGVRRFTGRERELAALTGLLESADEAADAVAISAIGGMAGIGKTALAVHWAHLVADRFPDGQLYVNLRGFDPSGKPVPTATAMRSLLDALAVAADRIPAQLEAQAALYRSLLAGRRMLVVLDNARDEQQVRPLLPGSPGCLAVVTSRGRLAGLVAAEGACALELDVLDESDAHKLLVQRLGAGRLDAEPDAAAELIRLCAGLPLALGIAAARISARPRLRLGALARDLQDAQARLDVLDAQDELTSVRAVFSWSLGSVPTRAARMFALLGVHPGPDITIPAAASLAGTSADLAREAVGQLAGAHLVSEHTPGRFAMHDLVRACAAEQASGISQAARRAALGRALDHYLHTAHHAAGFLLRPSEDPVNLAPPRAGVTAEQPADHQEALAWFKAEHQVLTSAVAQAARTGHDACAWQLPWAMSKYLDPRGRWLEWASIQRTAVAAATRLGDTAGLAVALRALAFAHVRLTDYEQARAHLTECAQLYENLGDHAGEARIYQALGWVHERQGRYAEALDHDSRALSLFEALGHRAGQAQMLNNIGWCHARLGDYQRTRAFCQQALAWNRKLDDRDAEAHTLDSLGYAEHKLGNLRDASDCYARALGIFRELGKRYNEADTLTHLGDARHDAGQAKAARAAWQEALDILDDLHHRSADQVRAKLSACP